MRPPPLALSVVFISFLRCSHSLCSFQSSWGRNLKGTPRPQAAGSSLLQHRIGVGTQIMDLQVAGPGVPTPWLFPFLLGPLLSQLLGERSDSLSFSNPDTFLA